MFNSIKAQIMLVVCVLTSLTIVQIYFSYQSEQSYTSGIENTQSTISKIDLVKDLQREVVDLQRNVLIYKDNGSESAQSRFKQIVESISTKLSQLANVESEYKLPQEHLDYVSSMQGHLKDYQENFEQVVSGREQRDTLFKVKILNQFNALINELPTVTNDEKLTQINLIKLKLLSAENQVFHYVLEADFAKVNEFNLSLNECLTLVNSAQLDNTDYVVSAIKNIKIDFNRLTQITRGYVFLINVVMTGSANEFLYLTNELNELVSQRQAEINQQIQTQISSIRNKNMLLSVLSIVITIFIVLILSLRLLIPINSISHVFRKLAKGETGLAIPSKERQDEIGELAQAASVFQQTNLQTKELLESAQHQNKLHAKMNDDLADAKVKAEQATAAKSMFLANMSHEIRTPLNGVVGLIDLCLKSKLNEKQQEYLSKAFYSSQILMNVINDILDFSKIEAGKLDIEAIEFDFNLMLESLISNIQIRANEKNNRLILEVSPHVPLKMTGDPTRISQVILNLANNAIKFTDSGLVKIVINTSHENGEDFLVVKVIDTGIGMSPEQLSRIFESFTQADGSTSRKYGGTGLGLSIVKQLVKLMGGHITAKSVENEGTEFCADFKLLAKSNTTQTDLFNFAPNQIYYFADNNQTFIQKSLLTDYGFGCDIMASAEIADFSKSAISLATDNGLSANLVLIELSLDSDIKFLADFVVKLNKLGLTCLFLYEDNQVGKYFSTDLKGLAKLSLPSTPANFINKLNSLSQNREKKLDSGTKHTTADSAKPKYKGKVLLVDDNEINLLVAYEIMNSFGVEIDMAEDGQQAIDKYKEYRNYDIIFMDIQMPVLDGYQATQEIIKIGCNETKICGLSANAMKEDLDKAFSLGMSDYISKPLQVKDIENVLKKYLIKNTEPA
ncbi:ATP-binding protein [Catenovulum maritimum]|uniref:Sensory/regulatory protein RpfC n=1 Tax=Catenovulum maritimum TaxID=1513271 RepID=A0A0J8JLE4_9ALTE|nr:ATP-binding protein [Catenovulum maritimum]KMT65381.1 hypothetical protein XM47_09675 [Catenovulum maritimum]